MTILEAALDVLGRSGEPMAVKDIYDAILRDQLYDFKAKSPRSVLSGTLRGHLRKQQPSKITEVSPGVYRKA